MIEQLEQIGLSNAQAKVYLAMLKLGESKTGQIIEKTNLQSSTVYHVLSSLLEKGVISFILKGKIKYYRAESPSIFIHFLEDKKRKLNDLMPQLKEMEEEAKSPQSAKIYKGMKGLQAAMSDVLISMRKGEEYCFFQAPHQNLFNPRVSLFFRNYHLKRAEKGIKVRGIAITTAKKKVKNIFKGLKHTKLKFVKEFLPTGLIVYKDKMITLDFERTPTAFVIQSKTVADSYRLFFNDKWKKAKV